MDRQPCGIAYREEGCRDQGIRTVETRHEQRHRIQPMADKVKITPFSLDIPWKGSIGLIMNDDSFQDGVSMDETVKTEKRGAVLEIVLHRPDRLNAMNRALFEGLDRAFDDASDHEIRSVLIRGEGRAFSVGGDIQVMAGFANRNEGIPPSLPALLQQIIEKIRLLEKPVLAMVHGACAGAALSLVLACDLAIASEECRLNLAFARIGLSPDGGATYFLPRHIGMKRATEIFMTGRTITAPEALDLGLIHRVVSKEDLLEEGRGLAQRLSLGPTAAFARMKKLMHKAFENSLHDQLALEAESIVESSQTKDFRSGVNAFLKKEPPSFVGE